MFRLFFLLQRLWERIVFDVGNQQRQLLDEQRNRGKQSGHGIATPISYSPEDTPPAHSEDCSTVYVGGGLFVLVYMYWGSLGKVGSWLESESPAAYLLKAGAFRPRQ